VAGARPTIRCLLAELRPEVRDPNQRSALASGNLRDLGKIPLNTIDHPLLEKAVTLVGCPPAELHKRRISAVRDQVWQRVKSENLRGAVWIDKAGMPWLCVAGIRKDGDVEDFYATFERKCVGGSDIFLPTETDQKRLRLEVADAADRDRRHALTVAVLDAITTAARTSEAQRVSLPTFVNPQSQFSEGAQLDVAVSSNGPDYPNEITLSVEITNFADARYDDVLFEVQAGIPGVPLNDWDVAPSVDGQRDPCWYVIVPEGWLERLLSDADARGTSVMALSPLDMVDGPDGFAHIVPRTGLAQAIVDGHVVRAACGRTFIPGRDPEDADVCIPCAAQHEHLESSASP
jgi:Protein of unknown function (DUF3039)